MIVYITAIQTLCHDLDDSMSEEQIIGYILEGLEPEIAAQIQLFNPETIKSLSKCVKSVESSYESMKSLKISEKSDNKSKKVNAVTEEKSEFEEKNTDPRAQSRN